MSRSVRVSIAGVDFSVRTDARPQYVRELAQHVEQELTAAKGTPGMTSHTRALLAAMSLADQLRELQRAHTRLKRDVRDRSQRILARLDRETDC